LVFGGVGRGFVCGTGFRWLGRIRLCRGAHLVEVSCAWFGVYGAVSMDREARAALVWLMGLPEIG